MEYRISKYIGWFLLFFSLLLVIANHKNPIVYFVFLYCGSFVILTNSYFYRFQYQKQLLLCLQTIVIFPIGYRVFERICFVIFRSSLEGENGEGSPLMFLVGGVAEFVVFTVLAISFFEVVYKKRE